MCKNCHEIRLSSGKMELETVATTVSQNLSLKLIVTINIPLLVLVTKWQVFKPEIAMPI